eukprot:351105-Chlamydomonas_euryale.AAC.2
MHAVWDSCAVAHGWAQVCGVRRLAGEVLTCYVERAARGGAEGREGMRRGWSGSRRGDGRTSRCTVVHRQGETYRPLGGGIMERVRCGRGG